jgi:hypothetical protein
MNVKTQRVDVTQEVVETSRGILVSALLIAVLYAMAAIKLTIDQRFIELAFYSFILILMSFINWDSLIELRHSLRGGRIMERLEIDESSARVVRENNGVERVMASADLSGKFVQGLVVEREQVRILKAFGGPPQQFMRTALFVDDSDLDTFLSHFRSLGIHVSITPLARAQVTFAMRDVEVPFADYVWPKVKLAAMSLAWTGLAITFVLDFAGTARSLYLPIMACSLFTSLFIALWGSRGEAGKPPKCLERVTASDLMVSRVVLCRGKPVIGTRWAIAIDDIWAVREIGDEVQLVRRDAFETKHTFLRDAFAAEGEFRRFIELLLSRGVRAPERYLESGSA